MTALRMMILMLFVVAAAGCPPTRTEPEETPPASTEAGYWLIITETYEDGGSYTSHGFAHVTGASTSCAAVQRSYEHQVEASLAFDAATDALVEEYDGYAWDDVDFVRDYCALQRDQYVTVGEEPGLGRAEAPLPGVYKAEDIFKNARKLRTAMGDESFFIELNSGTQSADADEWGAPVEGTYPIEQLVDDPPDVGRGVDTWAEGRRAIYHQEIWTAYAAGFDCDIEDAGDTYFDENALDGVLDNHQVTDGTLELTAIGGDAWQLDLTDGLLVDSSTWEDAGELTLSERFDRCEVTYENPWGGPDDEPPPPGR